MVVSVEVIGSALARSGLEHFVLYEFDTFSISNMNRQITCFDDTVGRNKADVLKETILKINPSAEVAIYERALLPDEIPQMLAMGDVIIPSADEWPLSITILGAAKEYGVPAIMSYPSGALGRVGTFLPSSPYAAECLVMPYKADYEHLKFLWMIPLIAIYASIIARMVTGQMNGLTVGVILSCRIHKFVLLSG